MDISLPKYIEEILDIICQYGEAYVVGGCVRDSLLGKRPNDWDITTDRMPSEVKEIFKDYKIYNKNGEKHGTVSILYKGEQVEITTYREEGKYLDGRHPSQVEFTRSLAGDLARRDFTINALAYNKKQGLIDLYGGLDDLKAQVIRTVGNPLARFSEDYLRILRGLRFASKLGFTIDEKTLAASYKLAPNILKYISGERVAKELEGLLLGSSVFNVLTKFSEIIFNVIPELKPCYNFAQNNPYHMHDVYLHMCYVVSYVPAKFSLRLAALLHDIAKPLTYSYEIKEGRIWGHFYNHPSESEEIARVICNRLRLSNACKDEVLYLIREHDAIIDESNKSLKRLIMRTPNLDMNLVLDLIDLKEADMKDHINLKPLDYNALRQKVINLYKANEAMQIKDLAINGKDLIALGYNGKVIGQILKMLLDLVVEEKLDNNKKELIKYLNNQSKIKN